MKHIPSRLREAAQKLYGSIPPIWKYVLLVYLTVRLTASITALIALPSLPSNPVVDADGYQKPCYSFPMEALFGIWERSDALWYIHIARDGYGKEGGSAAFFPLYPLLCTALHRMTGLPWIVCTLIISNICAIVALYFIYRISEEEHGTRKAEHTIWYQMLYPGSIFLLAPYTESLFLALAAGAFWAAGRNRWRLCGACGFLLSMTRVTGVVILLPLMIEFLRQRRKKRTVAPSEVLWLLQIPGGLAAVMAFWWYMRGDPLAFIHAQTGWCRVWTFPLTTLYEGIMQALRAPLCYGWGIYIFEALAVTAFVLLGLLSFRKNPFSHTLFFWFLLIIPWFFPYQGNMFLSNIRFLSILFPAFMALAAVTDNSRFHQAIKIGMASLYGLSTALYVTSQNMF